MKILIVNTEDNQGGAGKAAYRLHEALLQKGINCQMLVQSKLTTDAKVIGPKNQLEKSINTIRSKIDRIPVKNYPNRSKTLFSSSLIPFSGIVNQINKINPDIVHLHWVCSSMIRIEDLNKIKAPIVWSLHDMWPFTGGCHYDEECGAYKNSCGNCVVLKSSKSNDLSSKVFHRKSKIYSQIKSLTIIGLSRWLADCARNSTLFSDKKVVNLPNPINTDQYKKINRDDARAIFNLPNDKKLILFGAMNATSDPRKGFKYLHKSLSLINDSKIELVVYGSSSSSNTDEYGIKTHYVGNISDEKKLVALYNAGDVMVVPSIQENLSNTIVESLSCSLPAVAFDIGGNSDMIEHKVNGYLSKPFEEKDLAFGIEWVLNNNLELSNSARKKVMETFDSKMIANKYLQLYKTLLNE